MSYSSSKGSKGSKIQALKAHEQKLMEQWVQKAQSVKSKGLEKKKVISVSAQKQQQERWYEQMLNSDDIGCWNQLYDSHYFEHWNAQDKYYEVSMRHMRRLLKDIVEHKATKVQHECAQWVLNHWQRHWQGSETNVDPQKYTDMTSAVIENYMLNAKNPVPLIDALWQVDEGWMLEQSAVVFKRFGSQRPMESMHLLYKMYAYCGDEKKVHEAVRIKKSDVFSQKSGEIFNSWTIRAPIQVLEKKIQDLSFLKYVPQQWSIKEEVNNPKAVRQLIYKEEADLKKCIQMWLKVSVRVVEVVLDDILGKITGMQQGYEQFKEKVGAGSHLTIWLKNDKTSPSETFFDGVSELSFLSVSQWMAVRAGLEGKMETFYQHPWVQQYEDKIFNNALYKAPGWEKNAWNKIMIHMAVKAFEGEINIKKYPVLEQEFYEWVKRAYDQSPIQLMQFAVDHHWYDQLNKWSMGMDKNGTHISVLLIQNLMISIDEKQFKKANVFLAKNVGNWRAEKIQGVPVLEYISKQIEKQEKTAAESFHVKWLRQLHSALEQTVLLDSVRQDAKIKGTKEVKKSSHRL